jgi:hypothetical protein
MVNVLGFHFGAAYSGLDIQNLAIAADARIGSGYVPYMTAGMSYDFAHVRGLTNLNDFEATAATAAATGGTTGAQLPNNVALCMTLRTAVTGRSARGRFYAFPTGISTLSAANTFTVGYANGIKAFLAQLQLDAAALGWGMVVISRFTGGAPRSAGTTFLVTNIDYRNLICDSQRGRLPIGH